MPNWTSGPEAAFQWYNADYPESQFILKGNGDGTFQLQDRFNHLCLDLENNRTVAGTRVSRRSRRRRSSSLAPRAG